MSVVVETKIGEKNLIIETGKLAKQADGAVVVSYGDTVVLTTVVARELQDIPPYFPLFVDYREMTYASGKIPGGFFKREGRPSEKEIVTSRMIDRPLRPLFADGYLEEIQIVSNALSADGEIDPDILGIIGASAALAISDIPFPAPVGAVRIGKIGDKFIVNPTYKQVDEGGLDLVVCGWGDGVSMVEGDAKEIAEEVILEALKLGQEVCGEISSLIQQLVKKVGVSKKEIKVVSIPEELEKEIEDFASKRIDETKKIEVKKKRVMQAKLLKKECVEKFGETYSEKIVEMALGKLEQKKFREKIINEAVRSDGRKRDEVRPITCEVGILPRTHGSAVFTRGETQSLVTATLGTSEDEKRMDELRGESKKTFMLHYNFPPFSVGEVKPMRGPSRRDIGHGNLAERALKPMMPDWEDFPYTIRLVSDILESNGSSSMASVCGASLSCFDAGIPLKKAVAGVALGVIKEGKKYVLLSDIAGAEDKYGDMDLKIAGTNEGVTAIQMDVKIKGIEFDILKEAFLQSKQARKHILDIMNKTISSARESVSVYAPLITIIDINPEKIGAFIGPGGKNIRKIIAETGAKIDIDDEKNKVIVAGVDQESTKKAVAYVEAYTHEVKAGEIYDATVTKVMQFGAFVEILPGQEGLVHVSELDSNFVKNVEDAVKEGDKFKVKVLKIDEKGRINLSRKAMQGKETKDEKNKKRKKRPSS
ncbi:MAG: polyribonucleotide nucleotidyltransferase [Candidatus Omnitrophica bacterium]|nr:polyribonucleotide nucleotidyltransferase [Candidatus Omnitrophota bacterium]